MIQRLREHVAFMLPGRAVGNSAVQLWLRIYFSSENVFLHLGKEGLMHGANASTLDTGKMPQVRGIVVSHSGYAL